MKDDRQAYYKNNPQEAVRHALRYSSKNAIWGDGEDTYYAVKSYASEHLRSLLSLQWKQCRLRLHGLLVVTGFLVWEVLTHPVDLLPGRVWVIGGILLALINYKITQEEIRRIARNILQASYCYPYGIHQDKVTDAELVGEIQKIFDLSSRSTAPPARFSTVDDVLNLGQQNALLMTISGGCVLLLLYEAAL